MDATHILIAFAFGTVSGLSIGLTGGGGAIFAVPLLVYGLAMDSHAAVALSLTIVAVISAWGAVHAYRKGEIDFRRGVLFAVGGVATLPLGAKIGGLLPNPLLMTLFAAFMLFVAVRMYFESRKGGLPREDSSEREPPHTLLQEMRSGRGVIALFLSLLSGVLAGLFGIGGGLIIVPALMWSFHMDLRRAVGTSLFAVVLISSWGTALRWTDGIPYSLDIAGLFLLGGLVGVEVGARLRYRMPTVVLHRTFASLIIIIAGFIILTGGRPS